MSKLIRLVSLFLFLILFFLSASLSLASQTYLTVLVYHRFNEARYPSTNISQNRFLEQMEYLKKEKYQVLSLEELREFGQKAKGFPEKAVLITIDDAYRSVYEVAYPILKDLGYPFTVFLCSESIEKRYPAMMTLKMIEEMKKEGITFGNHTHTHPHLGIPSGDMTEEDYRLWVREEIQKCRQFLQKYGIESHSIAFLYGEYNQVVLKESRNLGYDLLFSQSPGSIIIPWDRQTVFPRQAIVGKNMNLVSFQEKLARSPLQIAFSQPSAGFLESVKPEKFAAQLLYPEKYSPGIVNMFVSELGRLEANFDPQTGWIRSSNQKKLTRSINRITITARKKNSSQFAWASWLICLPPPWKSKEQNQ